MFVTVSRWFSRSRRNRQRKLALSRRLVVEPLEQRAMLAPLLHDDFSRSVSASTWHIPTWVSPTDGTFVGRTQFRCTNSPPPTPHRLPSVRSGAAIIEVQTDNPSDPRHQSFLGTDLISSRPFDVGLDVKVRAKMNTATPGINGGMFLYAPPKPGSGTNHDEIDFELLTNTPDKFGTNIYGNEPLGRGHFEQSTYDSGSITDYHTYEIRWLPNQVSWLVDGKEVRTSKTSEPVPQGPLYLHLNMWVPAADFPEGYDGTLIPTDSAANRVFSMSVDWVDVQFIPGTISGVVFHDLNGDGIRQADEPGLAGRTIQLDRGPDGKIDATATTNADGAYSVTVQAGVYGVREAARAGWTSTVSPPPITVTADGAATASLGAFQNVTISGVKFHDLNGDGVRQPTEPGVAGWTLQLDRDANGSVDATAKTDSRGKYKFTNLGPGVYRIREVSQASWTRTTAEPADQAVMSGVDVAGLDFGDFKKISVSGLVFDDKNRDGKKRKSEPGLSGWVIELDFGADGTVDATALTGASGSFSFAGLGPGVYRLRQISQTGRTQTTANPADIQAVGGKNVAKVNFGNAASAAVLPPPGARSSRASWSAQGSMPIADLDSAGGTR